LTTAPALSADSPPPKAAAAPLGRHTAFGFAWMLLNTFLTKGVGIVGQIVIAWFLSPHDWQLVSLTYAIAGYFSLIRDAGLQTILVQRQQHLRRWIAPVFWFSVVLGLGTAIATIAAAPLMQRIFDQPGLARLVVIVAVAGLFSSLGTVPAALSQIQLRFRLQAVLGMAGTLILQGVAMLLAVRGFGAASYIVAFAMSNLFATVAFWIAVRPQIGLKARLRRWRLLLPSSSTLILLNLVTLAVVNGDYLALGLFHRAKNDESLGLFYFAFNLSWQTVILLTVNLGAVLFPAMTKLQNDRPRMLQAYLRSIRTLAVLSIPACLLQAAVTNSGFHMVFRSVYFPAIPVTQILCLGMAIRTIGLTSNTLNMAQGRYRLQLAISTVYCIIFLITMCIGAKIGAALSVAIFEAGFYIVLDPIVLGLILRINGAQPVRELSRVFLVPLAISIVATGAGWLAGHVVRDFHDHLTMRLACLIRIVIITDVSALLYIPLLRALAPTEWNDLLSFVRRKPLA
jgi:O-antigen/teichoic acid export membrane protein